MENGVIDADESKIITIMYEDHLLNSWKWIRGFSDVMKIVNTRGIDNTRNWKFECDSKREVSIGGPRSYEVMVENNWMLESNKYSERSK